MLFERDKIQICAQIGEKHRKNAWGIECRQNKIVKEPYGEN